MIGTGPARLLIICGICVLLGPPLPARAVQPLPADSLSAPANGDETPASALERRQGDEDRERVRSFAITPHRRNYCLLVTYDSDPNASTYEFADVNEPKHFEAKFQLSFKFLVWDDLFGESGDLYFGYTQLSFWQVYDKALSSPFRETNYEPEAFLAFDADFELLGLRARAVTCGLNHESNGQVEPFSRSWNRVFASLVAERGDLVVALRPWWRIPESDEEDDNPDIHEYLGYGELHAAYRHGEHLFSLLLRNNLRGKGNRGAVELGWSFPLLKTTRGYLQFFNGHGESLLDYRDSVNRISVGVMLFDWPQP